MIAWSLFTAVEVIKDPGSGIQKNDLIILLSTVFGVLFIVIIIAIILFVYFRRRSHSQGKQSVE